MSQGDRVKLAKARTQKIVDVARVSLQIHANNKAAFQSNILSKQIPVSHAANAFNEFARSMRYFELVRLAALWDTPRDDRISIPTVIDLIKPTDIQEALYEEHFNYIRDTAIAAISSSYSEEVRTQIRSSEVDFAQELALKGRQRLATAIRLSAKIQKSRRYKSIQNLRNIFLAHTLDKTTMSGANKADFVVLGDESWLLLRTVRIVDAIHIGINGTSFDWCGAYSIAQRNADSLWKNCTFSVSE